MTTFTNTNRTVAALLAVFVLFALTTPVAHAADYYDTIIPDYVDSYYNYNDTIVPDYVDTYYPYNDSIIPDYVDTFYNPTDSYWSPSSFGSGSYFGGGGFSFSGAGFGGGSSVYAPSTAVNNGNTYTYAPSNTNICTGGNVCNDNSVFNAPTTVTVSGGGGSYPVYTPVYQPVYTPSYSYPVYAPSINTGCGYTVVCPTPTYRAPYVSLTAAPYTGLELGPMGTVLYWSFLVLWCLAAAYLIAVKKVQNHIVRAINGYLYPAAVGHAHTRVHTAHTPKAHTHKAAHTAHVAKEETGIDSFVLSQINRSR